MITLHPIGKSADDLRFSILLCGRCAGGITVHSVNPPVFSYGIAVAPALRRRGIAREALSLLLAQMRAQGFTRAVVRVLPGNAASLALHASLGFARTGEANGALVLERAL